MRRLTVVTVNSLLIGLLLGVMARGTMRLIALVKGDDPEFTVGASTAIVILFVLAALGGGWGGHLSGGRPGMGFAIAAVASLPAIVMGISIGGVELVSSVGHQSPGAFVLIVLGAVVIAACVVASPTLSWRRARSSGHRNFTPERLR